jgi:hypothetical protein
MLSSEQVKKIAEGVGLEFARFDQDSVRVRRKAKASDSLIGKAFDYVGTFDPENNNGDAMQVFKALVDECKDSNFELDMSHGRICIENHYDADGEIGIFSEDFNNESICLAYLAVKELSE